MNVEQDDPDFVLDGDVLVEKDGDNVPHVIADLLSLGVGPHGQILLDLAQLVDVSLKLICKSYISYVSYRLYIS